MVRLEAATTGEHGAFFVGPARRPGTEHIAGWNAYLDSQGFAAPRKQKVIARWSHPLPVPTEELVGPGHHIEATLFSTPGRQVVIAQLPAVTVGETEFQDVLMLEE